MELLRELLQEESTLLLLYERLMNEFPQQQNALKIIHEDERRHVNILKSLAGYEGKADKRVIAFYTLLSKIFGVYFVFKLIKRRKKEKLKKYRQLYSEFPIIREIIREEELHMKQIDHLMEDERARYMGSTVLGLNDALVEMSGSLAGLTFALGNTFLVGISASIVGIAAAMSMAASEYLSRRAEGSGSPLKGALYTGVAYITVVILLVTPYFLLNEPILALLTSLSIAIILIGVFSAYISTIKERSFFKEFLTMLSLSMGVAFISFLIGNMVKILTGNSILPE